MKRLQKDHVVRKLGYGPFTLGSLVFYEGTTPRGTRKQKCLWFCVVSQDRSFPSLAVVALARLHKDTGHFTVLKVSYPAVLKDRQKFLWELIPFDHAPLSEEDREDVQRAAGDVFRRYAFIDEFQDRFNSAIVGEYARKYRHASGDELSRLVAPHPGRRKGSGRN